MSRPSLACLVVAVCASAHVACSGSVQPEAITSQPDGSTLTDGGVRPDSKTVDDAGRRGPVDSGEMCDLEQIIPPVLTVTDALTGMAICDATATLGDGGAVGLSPCDGSTGCTGTCQYTVEAIGTDFMATITVTAPGYSSSTVTATTSTCGCDQANCAAPEQVTVRLTHEQTLDAGPAPGCPSSEPSKNGGCAIPGLECEYGSSTNPYCNDVWECEGTTDGGQWKSMTTGQVCPPPSATCPASFAAASGHSACHMKDESELCEYPQGTCLCTQDPGGLPMVGGPQWSCTAAVAGCPTTIPELGSSCPASTPSDCDYGQCSGGVGLTCTDGRWALANVPCPA